ncbi:FAD-dependent oxidoreductase [Armatimonas sp.]|uniref:FAD-dependent oxidoreductase n=1 Tax=Armatimonas sp. TaxID=1872638 RepID=UPI003751EBBE
MEPSYPLAFKTDVCVVGGGPAGVAAALSAARNGARVLLIERMGFLGGSATAMQVPAFAPFSDRTKAIVRGIGWEVMTEHQRRLGRSLPDPDFYHVPQDNGRMDWVPIDVELLKRLYDELCEAADVTVLLHSFVGATCTLPPAPSLALFPTPSGRERGRLEGLILANKAGISLAKASVFIDATGDGDLAARAGCAFELGDESGKTQGMTLCFTVAGGSRSKYLEYVYTTGDGYLAQLVAQAKADGAWNLPDSSLVGMSFKSESVAGCNLGHVYGYDATDPLSISLAEREGRKVIAKLMAFLRRYVPGQESIELISSGPHIGVRESRRIVGEYTLTLEDYLSCRTFPDDIARCAYFIDLHAVTTEIAARAKSVTDGAQRSHSLPAGQSHGIPYRCLIPKGIENLLVAGRCLSAERAVQGATRVMPFCFAMGEAAGLAASMAVDLEGAVRGVDIIELRQRLKAQGAWLGD